MDVLFTDRVTTEFVDVDYFCDINLGPEKEIFAVDPESRSIWYEIHCVYKMISWYVFSPGFINIF